MKRSIAYDAIAARDDETRGGRIGARSTPSVPSRTRSVHGVAPSWF